MTAQTFAKQVLSRKSSDLANRIQKFYRLKTDLINLTIDGTLEEHETFPIVQAIDALEPRMNKLRSDLFNIKDRLTEFQD